MTTVASEPTTTPSREAWQALCDDGTAGMLVPRRVGGQGLELRAAIDAAQALAGLPLPFLSSAVLATLIAAALRSDSLLAELATGDVVATVATGGWLDDGPRGPVVSGELTDVLDGDGAEVWLVLARGRRGAAWVRLPRPIHTVDAALDPTRPTARAVVRDAPVEVLGPDDAYLTVTSGEAEVVRAAEVLGAAEQLGRPSDEGRLLLAGAWELVHRCTARAELGILQPALGRALTDSVQAVSSALPSPTAEGRSWTAHRARQLSGWRPPGLLW